MNEINLRDGLLKFLRYWWVLVLVMLAGGMAGLAIGQSLSPVYEATAFYEVDLDEPAVLARNGLTDLNSLDYARANTYLSPIYSVFFSPETEQALISVAVQSGIMVGVGSVHEPDYYVDRRGVVWLVTVRDADPEKAAFLASAWLQIVNDTVHDQLAHANAAEDLIALRRLVDTCLQDRTLDEVNQCAGTAFQTVTELEAFQADLNARIFDEQESAEGIEPVFRAEISDPAQASGLAVLYRHAVLMAAGSLLGLLVGILVLPLMGKRSRA
jgi:uncharacterized protein involved in exopolysaccharide biosynthesis